MKKFLSLFLILSPLFFLGGCGKLKLITPRKLAAKNPLIFTEKKQSNDISLSAVRLLVAEKALLLADVYSKGKKSMLDADFDIILLQLYNSSDDTYKVRVVHEDLATRGEVLPNFTIKQGYSFVFGGGLPILYPYTEEVSSNGLTKDDATVLETFAIFADDRDATVKLKPYSKITRLLLLPKSENLHKIMMLITSKKPFANSREKLFIEV